MCSIFWSVKASHLKSRQQSQFTFLLGNVALVAHTEGLIYIRTINDTLSLLLAVSCRPCKQISCCRSRHGKIVGLVQGKGCAEHSSGRNKVLDMFSFFY